MLLFAACGASRRAPALRTATVGEALDRAVERATVARGRYVVAVAPFTLDIRSTRLQSLRFAIPDLLARDLARSAQFELVDRDRLADALRSRDPGAARLVDSAAAAEVGSLMQARQLVLGRIEELPAGAGLRVRVRIADLERGLLGEEVEVDAQLSDIPAAQARLGTLLRAALGVPLAAGEREAVGRRPTAELAVLLAYGEGVRAETRGEFRDAADAFERAAELDPEFITAAHRARDARARAENGTAFPTAMRGLRAMDAAMGTALDRLNRPLDAITSVTRQTGNAADPAFATTTATLLLIIARP